MEPATMLPFNVIPRDAASSEAGAGRCDTCRNSVIVGGEDGLEICIDEPETCCNYEKDEDMSDE